MTKFVKCIDNTFSEESLTNGKIYEVIKSDKKYYLINGDIGNEIWRRKEKFKEVKELEQNTNKFRFIPKTEITEVIVDGIEGILIKETS